MIPVVKTLCPRAFLLVALEALEASSTASPPQPLEVHHFIGHGHGDDRGCHRQRGPEISLDRVTHSTEFNVSDFDILVTSEPAFADATDLQS